MIKEVEIDVWKVLFYIIIATLIILILWRAFGSSPPIEAIALGLTVLGVWLGIAGIGSSEKILKKLDKLEKLDQLDAQAQLLKDIKDILEKRL